MDILKSCPPSTIEVEGVFYDINTDFRAWLKFGRLLEDEETTYNDIKYLFLTKTPRDLKKAFNPLLDFYAPKNELPRKMGGSTNARLIDYQIDSDLIYAAFLEQYNIDLFALDKAGHTIPLHWHKFLALLNGLHGTKLNEIMSYRAFNENDKSDYKKQMVKLREAWRLPQKMSKATKKAYDDFNALFDKK